jgi:UBX domain-containing protein 1
MEQKPKKSTFVGKRYTLGSEEQQPSGPSVDAPTEDEAVSRLLTFWKDGFSVEDGPLLRYDDPQNQQHLNAIKAG